MNISEVQPLGSMTPSERVSLIGARVHISVFEADGPQSVPIASQTGRVSIIGEDENSFVVAFGTEATPLAWDKHQFVTRVWRADGV